MNAAPNVKSAVADQLPGADAPPITFTELWEGLGPFWTRATVNEALTELLSEGRAMSTKRDDGRPAYFKGAAHGR